MNGTRPPYGHNIVRLERDYSDFMIKGDGTDYSARRRGPTGSPIGSPVKDRTLDGLAVKMDQARAGRRAR